MEVDNANADVFLVCFLLLTFLHVSQVMFRRLMNLRGPNVVKGWPASELNLRVKDVNKLFEYDSNFSEPKYFFNLSR